MPYWRVCSRRKEWELIFFQHLALVMLASTMAQLGLTQAIVRLVAESMGTDRPGRARQAILLVIRLTAVGAFVVAAILAFGGGQWVAEKVFYTALMSQVMGLVAVWVVALTFQSVMAEFGITYLMSRADNCWDNSARESFCSSLKRERADRKVYRMRAKVKADVF